ncbi:nitroreductase family protein [Pedobacter sp.]|uniref:nitroreductase family protein n=1 Tax=Pedobacter sp. TaxID=1411316 RepID=UPI003D7F5141
MAEEEFSILSNIIKRRRSIFPNSYTTEEVPVTLIKQILESANYAPTHKLTEPWRFRVYRNAGKDRLGEALAEIYKQRTPEGKFLQKKYDSIKEKVNSASAVIVICAELHPDQVPEWEEIAAVACAVQNMALTAEALHVGAYWSSPEILPYLKGFLELSDQEKCYGLFYVGNHNEKPREANRTPIEEKVKWVEE